VLKILFIKKLLAYCLAFGIKPPPPYGVLPLIRGGEDPRDSLEFISSSPLMRGGG